MIYTKMDKNNDDKIYISGRGGCVGQSESRGILNPLSGLSFGEVGSLGYY